MDWAINNNRQVYVSEGLLVCNPCGLRQVGYKCTYFTLERTWKTHETNLDRSSPQEQPGFARRIAKEVQITLNPCVKPTGSIERCFFLRNALSGLRSEYNERRGGKS